MCHYRWNAYDYIYESNKKKMLIKCLPLNKSLPPGKCLWIKEKPVLSTRIVFARAEIFIQTQKEYFRIIIKTECEKASACVSNAYSIAVMQTSIIGICANEWEIETSWHIPSEYRNSSACLTILFYSIRNLIHHTILLFVCIECVQMFMTNVTPVGSVRDSMRVSYIACVCGCFVSCVLCVCVCCDCDCVRIVCLSLCVNRMKMDWCLFDDVFDDRMQK